MSATSSTHLVSSSSPQAILFSFAARASKASTWSCKPCDRSDTDVCSRLTGLTTMSFARFNLDLVDQRSKRRLDLAWHRRVVSIFVYGRLLTSCSDRSHWRHGEMLTSRHRPVEAYPATTWLSTTFTRRDALKTIRHSTPDSIPTDSSCEER